ncbi:polyphosphate kinase 2 [Marinobacterium rhizophilum]|uniref:polyphosphate kinase 2 n=1 Tax=Marinobacterium rhizophilum TaxID=420402 RepID=UPI00036029C3|nr:polyphosphate kinase 2 [Marinobacterium rhizophilum]
MSPDTRPEMLAIDVQSAQDEEPNWRPANLNERRRKTPRMSAKEYRRDMHALQIELQKFQRWVRENGIRICVLFEGRDAAGKGGTIKRLIEHLNPRGYRVVALEKPTEQEQGQWYFQRYIKHLPNAGEIVLFDRSWYNRAGVERVMGFCSQAQVDAFMQSAPALEQMLVNSGLRLVKLWFSVSKKEQRRRFHRRETDPLRRWKLSPIDLEAQRRWRDYTHAKEAMFQHTSTTEAPWVQIRSNDKKRARVNAIRYLLSLYDYPDRDLTLLQLDRRIVSSPKITTTPLSPLPNQDKY